MIYQRGSRGSYDLWAEQVGDNSYRWDNIVKYFDKSVDVTPYNNSFRAANASVNTGEYSLAAKLQSSGPLKVSWSNFAMPFSSWGIQGLFASGMPRLSGFFSSGDLHGAAYNVSACRVRAEWKFIADRHQHSRSRSIPSTRLGLPQKIASSSTRSSPGRR
jgi:choline dehydrogenase